jgi:hypothetical protein
MRIGGIVSGGARLGWQFARSAGWKVAVVGSLVLMLLLVHRKIYERMIHSDRNKVNVGGLKVSAKPAWATEPIVISLKDAFPGQSEINIMDEDVVAKIGKLLEANPWVERVKSIEKRPGSSNKLVVSLDFRKPVAAVEHKGRYYLVDAKCVRLPGEYSSMPRLNCFIAPVVGVNCAPTAPGRAWDSDSVRAGVGVAVALDEYHAYDAVKIVAVDVQNVGGHVSNKDSEVVIWTGDRVAIEWGRSANTEKFGEISDEQKMKNLRLVMLACPSLKGLKYVKLQFERPYVVMK